MTDAKNDSTQLIAGLPKEEYFVSGHRACAGCGEALALRHITKAAGKNTIVAMATGCMEVISTPYPETAWNLPWIHAAFENNSAVASGIDRALKAQGQREGKNILVLGGDGSTFDIGFGALSGAIERGHKFTYVVTDNEAYMNCLALSTDVLTKEGLKKITEVKEGDMVYAFNQKTNELVLKKCAGVFDNGGKEVFELNTLHHTIKATSNHPFLTVQKNGRGKENSLVWKTIAELRRGDQIISLKNLDAGASFSFKGINLSKKGDFKVNKLNELKIPSASCPDLMEFFGLFLGDGWVRLGKGEIGFALPEGKQGRNRLLMIQERIFGLVPRLSKDYVYFNSVNLAKFIDSLGFNRPAKEKTIPDWVFTLPADEKESFIRGIMLSDGYKTGNSSRIVSASFELLKRTRLLLQTMNYRVGKIHRQRKEKGTFVVYRKLLKDSEYGYICFSEKSDWDTGKYPSQYKYQNFLIGNKSFEIEKVQSIKLVGVEPTLDLRVEGEHNFIADGIVVHNTGIQRSGATFPYANTTTAPFGKKIHGKQEPKKPITLIVASHGVRYVATASIANLPDLYSKVRKALSTEGPTFVHVLTPCTPGWGIDPSKTLEISRLALQSRISPLYEIEDGVLRFNQKIEDSAKKPVLDYLKMQSRFKNLGEEEVNKIQSYVDDRYNFLLGIEGKKVFDVLF